MSGDTLVNADTGEIIAECTPDEARKLTDRMHTALGVLTELYIEAYQRRAWAALGHPSWDAYIAAEFGRYHLRLPAEERDEAIASMRAAGLSIRAIAATGVASKKTVERSIAASGVANDDTCTGTDGKKYDAVARAKARREAEIAAPETSPSDDAAHPGTPAPSPGENTGPAAAAPSAGGGQSGGIGDSPAAGSDSPAAGSGPDVTAQLPADWRERIGYAAYLLGCPADALRPVLDDDDRADLEALRAHLNAVLNQEQTR